MSYSDDLCCLTTPKVSYGKFASILVSKGYRVARVEQTETPEMLKERNSRQTKKSKVVEREVCSVMTKGTRTFCHLDDLTLLEEATGGSASVLICINEAETTKTEEGEEITEYGVCCIDTVLGVVTVAQFQDDKQRCRLRTLLSKYPPSEVLLPVGHCSPFTTGVLKFLAPKAAVEYLRGDEFPSASDTIKSIETGNYFDKDSFINSLPPILQAIIDGSHDGSSSLVLSAFGGALWQLKRSLIDYEIISLGKILAYVPPDEEISEGDKEKSLKGLLPNSIRQIDGDECGAAMVLDEVALTNLEVLVNNHDRSEKGSLWAFIDRTRTPFGRRLLRQWLVHPLLRPSDIKARSAAVEEILSSLDDISGEVKSLLKNVPDLERLLARVHSNGLKSKGPDHPDSRAVMYETDIYNTRKIRDFADVLTGFEVVLQVAKKFENKKLSSVLLQKTMNSKNLEENPGRFPLEEMAKLLKFYREIFDEKQAKKEGNIRPRPGVDAEYDQAKEDIRQAQLDLEQYLRDMKRKTGINDLKYFGNNKDRYQIEVPMQQTSKVPSSWTSKSQKKTHRRYWTEEIEQWLKQLMDAEDRLASAQRDTLRRVFEKFDSNRAVWSSALSSTANLDALLSLATISSMPGYVWPEILTKSEVAAKGGPQLNIKGGRHPMLEFAMSQRFA